jgi:hypothetical protein
LKISTVSGNKINFIVLTVILFILNPSEAKEGGFVRHGSPPPMKVPNIGTFVLSDSPHCFAIASKR